MLSDELNHASIIDGCRLSRSDLAVYRHADMDHLEQLLAERAPTSAGTGTGTGTSSSTGTSTGTSSSTGIAGTEPMPTIVVTDSVFSMDGDAAPLDHLLSLCARHDALLILDEAHAVLGPRLPPVARGGEAKGSRDRAGVRLSGRMRGTVVRVGTMSKTLGALGGFVAASRDVIDLLVNRARSYIFSTALTPADAAAALAALRILRSEEGAALTGRLADLIDRMAEAGIVPPDHPSPIVPVILGSEQAALECLVRTARSRPLGSRHPATDGACRYEPPAGHAVGRPLGYRCRLPARGVVGAPCGFLVDPLSLAHARRRSLIRMARPRRVVAVVGTGTDIGKTWVSAHLLTRLRGSRRVGVGSQTGPIV